MSQDPTCSERRQVEILNALGLHMRPAAKFVKLASQFQSEIRVYRNGQENHGEEIDGKSILSLAMLAAEQGAVLEVEARGPDAEEALVALAALVSARFYEDDNGDSVEHKL